MTVINATVKKGKAFPEQNKHLKRASRFLAQIFHVTARLRRAMSRFHVFHGETTQVFLSQQTKIPKTIQLQEDSPMFHFS